MIERAVRFMRINKEERPMLKSNAEIVKTCTKLEGSTQSKYIVNLI